MSSQDRDGADRDSPSEADRSFLRQVRAEEQDVEASTGIGYEKLRRYIQLAGNRQAQLRLIAENDRELLRHWDRPAPLGNPLGVPQPFPTHLLPRVLRDLVRAVAGNRQVPEVLCAFTGISCAAILAGPRLCIERQDGWREPLTSYALIGAESGARKTPAMKDMTKPLERIQIRQIAKWRAAQEAETKPLDRQISDLLRSKETAKDAASKRDITRQVDDLKAEKAKILEGPEPFILAPEDTTPEALGRAMALNGGHAGLIDDEGTFLEILSGLYNGGQVPNIGAILKGIDGRPVAAGRITRDQPRIIRAILSMMLAVQPSVLAKAAKNEAFRNKGLLGRNWLALPKSLVGFRNEDDATPYNRVALARWQAALERIAAYDMPGQETDEDDFPAIKLSAPALKLHKEFLAAVEVRLRPDEGDLANLPGWGSKHPARVLKLAGLFHLIDGHGPDTPVSEPTMRAAIEIGWWAVPHAARVFGMKSQASTEDMDNARGVLAWVRNSRGANWLTVANGVVEIDRRVVQNRHRAAWCAQGTVSAVQEVLDLLDEGNWLRKTGRLDGCGRFKDAYLVWPGLFELTDDEVAQL